MLSIFRLCTNQADTNGATLNIDDASVYDLDHDCFHPADVEGEAELFRSSASA